jgi:hypothetical protein
MTTPQGVQVGKPIVLTSVRTGAPIRTGWDVDPEDYDPDGYAQWFGGEGPPPAFIPGAKPGDMYLNETTGELFQLR